MHGMRGVADWCRRAVAVMAVVLWAGAAPSRAAELIDEIVRTRAQQASAIRALRYRIVVSGVRTAQGTEAFLAMSPNSVADGRGKDLSFRQEIARVRAGEEDRADITTFHGSGSRPWMKVTSTWDGQIGRSYNPLRLAG